MAERGFRSYVNEKQNQCKYIPEPQMDPGFSTISGGELVELLHCGSVFLSICLTANNHYLAVTLWQMINDT